MMTTDESTNTDEYDYNFIKAFASFLVISLFTLSLILFIFYSTMRSRSLGIANGYLKAAEMAYHTNTYNFQNHLPNHSFETGIYKVSVSSVKSKSINNAIIIKIEVQDKFFQVTHYAEELKLLPILTETLDIPEDDL